jgi:rubredoxin
MMQETRAPRAATDEYVEFWAAGAVVKGEFQCSECGYGVAIVRALPLCPMCGGKSWEQTPWSPFTRSGSPL